MKGKFLLTLFAISAACSAQEHAALVSTKVEAALPERSDVEVLKAIAHDRVWVIGDMRKDSEKMVAIKPGEWIQIVSFEDTKKRGMLILPIFTRKEITRSMFKSNESVLWMDGRVILGLIESNKYNVAINPGVYGQMRIENDEVVEFNKLEGIKPNLKRVR